MSLTIRMRSWLVCGIAVLAAVTSVPVYGQFGGGQGGFGGGGGGGFGGHAYVPPGYFPGVTLDGPRELDPDAPAVIDAAQFVPPELQKPLTWDVVDLPLDDLATEFSTRVGLPVLIDKTSVTDVGIPLDEPITASLVDTPAYLLLSRVLTGLGLTWDVEDNIVRITSTEIAEERMEATVYPVGDLLQTGCTPQSLIDTLQSQTDTEWEDIDGIGGSVSQAGRTLVLRQSQPVHRQVAGILEALRHPRRQTIVGDSALREAIEQKLDQTLKSVSFDEVPLDDAIAHLADEAGIPVVIDETALTDVGITLDEPVTLHLENRPARTMFRLVLTNRGLATVNRDAVLTVTTTEIADEDMLTVVYEVSDLCRTEDQTNALIDVLQNETGGEWESIDGVGGDISMPRVGTLVLRQAERVHREIAGILEQLRKSLGGETLADPEDAPDAQVESRYYHLPKDQAHDLQVLFPTLIEPGSWEGWNEEGAGMIRVIANTKQDAILMVRHQRAVLKKIERFLSEMSRDSREKGGFLGNPGYVPTGGGFGGGGFGGGGGGGGGFGAIPPESEP